MHCVVKYFARRLAFSSSLKTVKPSAVVRSGKFSVGADIRAIDFSGGSRGGGGRGDVRPPVPAKKKKKKKKEEDGEEKEKKIGPGIRQVRPPQHNV